MNKIDDFKKHFFTQAHAELRQIADPLFEYLAINSFQFSRVYKDNHLIYISTDPDWVCNFWEKKHYAVTVCSKLLYVYKSGFFLGDEFSHYKQKEIQSLYQDYTSFNRGHIFVAFRENKNYIDVFTLSSDLNNESINIAYLANIDVLEKFFDYFLLLGTDFIREAEQHKILLGKDRFSSNHDTLKLKNSAEANAMLNRLKIKQLPIKGPNGCILLTESETNCLKLYAKGVTSKEIAHHLGISTRTSEKHLQNIREKTGLTSRSHLLQNVMNDPLIKKLIWW